MRFSLLLLFLAGWSCRLSAQLSPSRFIAPQYTFEYLPLNAPADYGTFNDAIEDQEGFLWLSGSKGLHVFDGKSLISYSNGDPAYPISGDSPLENYEELSPGIAGRFWLRESGLRGMICFDPIKRKLAFKKRSWPGLNGQLYGVCTDMAHNLLSLYCNIPRNTASIYRGWQRLGDKPLWEGTMYALQQYNFVHTGANYWFSSGRTLVRISASDYSAHTYSLPPSMVNIYGTASESGAIYLIDSKGEHIYTWDAEKDSIVVYMNLPRRLLDSPLDFAMDKEYIYLASYYDFYLISRKDQTIQNLSGELKLLREQEDGTPQGGYLCKLLPIRNNGVFFISSKSVLRLKPKLPSPDKFRQKIRINNPGVTPSSFRQLTEDDRQDIYASYYTGIVVKKKGQDVFSPFPGLPAGVDLPTYSLNYWKGYLIFNNLMINRDNHKTRFIGHQYHATHTTQYLDHDTLWYYSWWTNLLARSNLVSGQTAFYPLNAILGNPNYMIGPIAAIIGDNTGHNLWLATKGQGIALIGKDGKLKREYPPRQLGLTDEAEPGINALQLTDSGLWFGYDNGLGLLHPQTGIANLYPIPRIKNAAEQNRSVFSMAPDTAGNLYRGSSSGLIYFDTKRRIFYTLPVGHPMEKIECNRNAAFCTSDYRFYFGTINGLYSFLPEELSFNQLHSSIKPIKIDNISIFNSISKSYRYLGASPDSCIKLGASDNSINIHLSLPEYNEEVCYAYRLLGPDSKWSAYRPEEEIFLSFLPSDDHVLEIKASTDLKDSHASYYRLTFHVEQVWYKKAWTILFFGLGFCGLALLAVRFWFNQKYQRQKALGALRTRISTDLHDDIGSVLSGLAMQSEMLAYSAREEQKTPLIEISNMSRDVMESMRDIVWAMDSRKDHYENLADRMRAFAEKSFTIRNIEHEFVIRDIQHRKFIDPEKRQNIYLIFKEAVTNILKHSDARFVSIVMEQLGDHFHLSIRDNGTKAMPGSSSGMGISNMMMRARKIGGVLIVKAEDGFSVTLTLRN